MFIEVNQIIFNHIIKLSMFIEVNQINNMSL
jgi:hypothetical protein